MSERKQQILQSAIEIIANEGYGSLSMRSLARANGMKLGALQYHFRTWEEMLRALIDYIAEEYRRVLDSVRRDVGTLSVRDIAEFMLEDSAGDSLMSDRLWPQLWAMEQVEPLVADLLEEVYAEILNTLERALEDAGSQAPHAEALSLLSLFEGESLFTGSGRRWEEDKKAVRDTVLNLIDTRYGEQP